jgi:perosamine synthetase
MHLMHLPITRVVVGAAEAEAIRRVLESGWLVQGPQVKAFEDNVAAFTGARHAIAVTSCTSGQMIMSRVAALSPGDEALVPAFTWISTANAIEFVGARPVLVDIDLTTFNIDLDDAECRVTPRTRAIVPVHLFGLSADMARVRIVAAAQRLHIIEDCACGLGGRIDGRHCGLDGLGGILSFHPRKSITTGEGGMIITDRADVDRAARSFRDHGALKSDLDRHQAANSFLLTEYPVVGYNMRMTDLQGALGVAQMVRLSAILERKRRLAAEFDDRLRRISWLQRQRVPAGYDHGYQSYCTLFKPEEAIKAVQRRDQRAIDQLSEQRNEIMRMLERGGIATRQGTHAVHIQAFYQQKYGWRAMDFPAAYAADRLTVALPFFPTMTDVEIEYLFEALAAAAI